jgi:protein SMG7
LQNRQHYSSLTTNIGTKAPSARAPQSRPAGKGKGRGDRTSPVKEAKKEPVSPKKPEISMAEIFKAFCVKFVRLNGILFTRTRFSLYVIFPF